VGKYRTKVVRAKKGLKGRRVYGAFPSAPGEPPRKQTGRLRASVTYEVDETELTGRVGTNVRYGRYLELGTEHGLLPRPWLRRALAESKAEIDSLLSRLND
jgi:phage gpG-like protein